MLSPKTTQAVIDIARSAGAAAKKIYDENENVKIERKADNSPLTIADKEAHNTIISGLKSIEDCYPALSEESDPTLMIERLSWDKYWLIDPLDGTKEFINRSGDFTVNIALIEKGRPIFGVVYAPVVEEMFFAAKGQGAYQVMGSDALRELKVRDLDKKNLACLVSRSHLGPEADLIKKKFPGVKLVPMGSSLKICRIAQGEADFYVRANPTSEWDTAAAQIVLEEAGGQVISYEGEPLLYNKENILNPSFLAYGDPLFEWEKLV